MSHPALTPDSVAVITGGAAGIGFAAAMRFVRLGLRVCIADLGQDRLSRAAEALSPEGPGSAGSVMVVEADVSRVDEVRRLEAAVRDRFGGTDILMNNAGVQPGSGIFGPAAYWERVLAVNLWGVIHGTQVFVPGMIERGRPGSTTSGTTAGASGTTSRATAGTTAGTAETATSRRRSTSEPGFPRWIGVHPARRARFSSHTSSLRHPIKPDHGWYSG